MFLTNHYPRVDKGDVSIEHTPGIYRKRRNSRYAISVICYLARDPRREAAMLVKPQ